MGYGCSLGGSLVAGVPGMSAFGKGKLKTACKNLVSSKTTVRLLLHLAYSQLKALKPVNNRQMKKLDHHLI